MDDVTRPKVVETALSKFRRDFDAKAADLLESVDRKALAALVMVIEAKKLQALFDVAETDDAMTSAKMRGGIVVMDDLLYLLTLELGKRMPPQEKNGEAE